MAEAPRIDVKRARQKVQAGEALLICAYDDPGKCRTMALETAIALEELQARAATLPRDETLIFYCA